MLEDIEYARKSFEYFEKVFITIQGKGKDYLRIQSKTYKKSIYDIQGIILPSIKRNCPDCENFCCKLYNPDLSIYIARSVGGFHFGDYLLARFDKELPTPIFKNMEKNLCPFWAHGCTLPLDCRSYICIRYFCDRLKKEVDMQVVSEHLNKIKNLLMDFSIQVCLGLQTNTVRRI